MSNYFTDDDSGLPHIDVDPDSNFKYTWSWTKWLAKRSSVGIATASFILDTGLVAISSPVIDVPNGKVTQTFQLTPTPIIGNSFAAVCRITTSDTPPMIEDQTIIFDVVEK